MEKDWTDKMSVAEYNKLCDYCRENGYNEYHKGFKLHNKGYEYDKGLSDFTKGVKGGSPALAISIVSIGNTFLGTNSPYRVVQVELKLTNMHHTGFANGITIRKFVTTVDQFIEFTNKITDLEKLAKEFKI